MMKQKLFAGFFYTNVIHNHDKAPCDIKLRRSLALRPKPLIIEQVLQFIQVFTLSPSIGHLRSITAASLKVVVLSPNTRTIVNNVFRNCTALKERVIPKSLIQVSSATAIIVEGWTEDQTIYFEASEREIYTMWGYAWNLGCNAKFVLNYVAPKA